LNGVFVARTYLVSAKYTVGWVKIDSLVIKEI